MGLREGLITAGAGMMQMGQTQMQQDFNFYGAQSDALKEEALNRTKTGESFVGNLYKAEQLGIAREEFALSKEKAAKPSIATTKKTIRKIVQEPELDDLGDPILDKNGLPIYTYKSVIVGEKIIMYDTKSGQLYDSKTGSIMGSSVSDIEADEGDNSEEMASVLNTLRPKSLEDRISHLTSNFEMTREEAIAYLDKHGLGPASAGPDVAGADYEPTIERDDSTASEIIARNQPEGDSDIPSTPTQALQFVMPEGHGQSEDWTMEDMEAPTDRPSGIPDMTSGPLLAEQREWMNANPGASRLDAYNAVLASYGFEVIDGEIVPMVAPPSGDVLNMPWTGSDAAVPGGVGDFADVQPEVDVLNMPWTGSDTVAPGGTGDFYPIHEAEQWPTGATSSRDVLDQPAPPRGEVVQGGVGDFGVPHLTEGETRVQYYQNIVDSMLQGKLSADVISGELQRLLVSAAGKGDEAGVLAITKVMNAFGKSGYGTVDVLDQPAPIGTDIPAGGTGDFGVFQSAPSGIIKTPDVSDQVWPSLTGGTTGDIEDTLIPPSEGGTIWGQKVRSIADKYGIDSQDILSIMRFETGGTFDPAKQNKWGYTGLIQFGDAAAERLGTTTAELAKMSREDQLDFVEKYFDLYFEPGSAPTIGDLYMSVLWPQAIGKDDEYAVFTQGTKDKPNKAYDRNKGLDLNKDGVVSKGEAVERMLRDTAGSTEPASVTSDLPVQESLAPGVESLDEGMEEGRMSPAPGVNYDPTKDWVMEGEEIPSGNFMGINEDIVLTKIADAKAVVDMMEAEGTTTQDFLKEKRRLRNAEWQANTETERRKKLILKDVPEGRGFGLRKSLTALVNAHNQLSLKPKENKEALFMLSVNGLTNIYLHTAPEDMSQEEFLSVVGKAFERMPNIWKVYGASGKSFKINVGITKAAQAIRLDKLPVVGEHFPTLGFDKTQAQHQAEASAQTQQEMANQYGIIYNEAVSDFPANRGLGTGTNFGNSDIWSQKGGNNNSGIIKQHIPKFRNK